MASRKVSTTVYLTEEQVIALKELHVRTRVPVAEYIRLGINMILEKNSERLPGQISLFDSFDNAALGVGKKSDKPDKPEK
ncbi:MAG: ribbon-helix-helix domain-containing protein [Bdellovibrionales bacterium]|nr:ribbon-helix-helix domain-containing protein [Bdellovibrionales bacterium]